MSELTLNPQKTALVLIDLQRGVLGMTTAPHSAAEVLERSTRLAAAFRETGGLVVLVRVSFSSGGADALRQPVDTTWSGAAFPAGWDELVPELGQTEGDLVITKRQWGAFYGTELDLQLRRRGINTIVLAGIATNFGVESTARAAHEHGYAVVLVEDAMSSLTAEAHQFSVQAVFPRLGRVRSTQAVLDSLSSVTEA